MTDALQCLACGHEDPRVPASDMPSGIFVCHECGAHMAYGRLLPRIVIEPYRDERGVSWVRQRFQDPKTKEDLYVIDIYPQLAMLAAKNLLSLVVP